MSDDLLREAARSLRDLGEAPGSSTALTRMRVMTSLHGARRRRATRAVLWIPTAAVLAGATAAAATGQVPRLWGALGRMVGAQAEPPALEAPIKAPAQTPRGASPRPHPAGIEAAPLPNTEERVDWESTESRGRLRPTQRADGREAPNGEPAKRVRAMSSPKPDQKAAVDPDDVALVRELELYREAHRAHFETHDCQAAVLGWERYLAEAPGGRFTLEARYNRALCLVRLGRQREAAAALYPFAEGSYGGYRRDDARALLEALESDDPGSP